ncbi:MAG: MGMT family protein [Firmicutes bacterium]|nr:MGMT family protein [Bacillota bacterium]
MSPFRDAVLALVARIPHGRLATYGQIAGMAGFPRRPRQVGMVLKGLPESTDLPWHRVVNALGYVPSKGRWWGAQVQIQRLRDEGIDVDDRGNLDLAQYQWEGELPATPKRRLREGRSKACRFGGRHSPLGDSGAPSGGRG